MFNFSKITAAAAVAVAMTASAASAITMTFGGATFDDGGTISGSFDFDGTTVSAVSIVTTDGTTIEDTQTYTSGAFSGGVIQFGGTTTAAGFTPGLAIALASPSTFADLVAQTITSADLMLGATTVFGNAPSFEGISDGLSTELRVVDGGVLTVPTAAVPLPAGGVLLIGGLGALVVARRKKS